MSVHVPCMGLHTIATTMQYTLTVCMHRTVPLIFIMISTETTNRFDREYPDKRAGSRASDCRRLSISRFLDYRTNTAQQEKIPSRKLPKGSGSQSGCNWRVPLSHTPILPHFEEGGRGAPVPEEVGLKPVFQARKIGLVCGPGFDFLGYQEGIV
jgi:hypothetical protein